MIYFLQEKKDCTGCMACVNICPRQCIEMKLDHEGFLYPEDSDMCVHCGLCEKSCPQIHPINNDNYPLASYALLSMDLKVWKQSASGGAFTEICKAFDDGNTVFFGAGWDGFVVHHFAIESINDISKVTKSKYIQSQIDNAYQSVRQYLEEEKKVVFCGTPCQIAGLRSFLRRDYEKLLLIDLICHGVGNTSILTSCIKCMEEQLGKQIKSYEFRAKRKTHETDYLTKICFESGEIKYYTDDPYMQLFLKQNCLRPSCGGNCKYRVEKRQGDITIADFKGLYQVFSELRGVKYNYSSVVVNSRKGLQIIGYLKKNTYLHSCSIEDIKEFNPLFYKQTWTSQDRDAFFFDYIENPRMAIKKWTHSATEKKKSIKILVFEMFPVSIRKKILNCIDKTPRRIIKGITRFLERSSEKNIK